MKKTLAIAAMLVFGFLLGHVTSGSHPLIALPGTAALSSAATPQVAAPAPQKKPSEAQAIVKAPKPSPSWLAINDMVEAAKEMGQQVQIFDALLNSLRSDTTTVGRNKAIQDRELSMLDKIPPPDVGKAFDDLRETYLQVSQSTKK
jgi:hypothetical protein